MPRISQEIRWNIATWARQGLGRIRIQQQLLQITNEHFNLSTIGKIISKWRNTGNVDNLPGAGRQRSARTLRNINTVREEMQKNTLIRSPKRKPLQLARQMNISKSSVARILKIDLHFKPYKKVIKQRLTNNQKESRICLCRNLLERFNVRKVRRTIFTDETVFSMDGYLNVQNDRIYARNYGDIPRHELIHQQAAHPMSIMVFCGVSYEGKLPLIFIEPGVHLNAQLYQELILIPSIRAAINLYPNARWVWQQDSAPPHRAVTTQTFLERNTPDFIRHNQWPANSCDMAVMDFGIFAKLKESVFSHNIQNMVQLRHWILFEWNRFPQHIIRRSIDSWRGRMQSIVDLRGEHYID